uniref:Uncharacterized protein n=1 Tax=Clytia hemisphaerica TaxID=252671 RepID=A0A7M5X4V2_9CNID|eukprot:TCONS_00004808-protein
MKHLLSILLISLTTATMVYICVWSYFSETLTIQKRFYIDDENYEDFDVISVDNQENKTLNIASLSIICFWTLFWNGLLVIFLQCSPHIDRSAVFLLQQTVFLGLTTYGLILVIVSYLFIKTMTIKIILEFHDMDTRDSFSTIMQSQWSLLFTLQLIYCFYISLRYYLTHREHGMIEVAWGCKLFFFVVVSVFPYLIFLLINSSAVSLWVVFLVGSSFLLLVSIVELIFLVVRRRRQHVNQITLPVLWCYLLVNTFYVFCSYSFFVSIMDYLSEIFRKIFRKNIVFIGDCNYNKLVLAVVLVGPLFNSFCAIFLDRNLRKTFFERFTLAECCCRQQQHLNLNNENEPLLGNQVEDVRNIEGNVEDFRTGVHQDRLEDHACYGAHEVREVDVRTMPRQAPELDVACAAHSAPFDDEAAYDVTKGAHGARPDTLITQKTNTDK